MDDKKQVKLLEDAIALYEDGAILEAGDKAREFIEAITDFLNEESAEEVTDTEELVPIGSLTPGTVVEVGGIQMEILDTHYPTAVEGEGVFCLAKDIAFCKAFDEDNCNNWASSSLRNYLNIDFKDQLTERIGEDALLAFERDLTSDDGLKDYGICVDKISLISCDEYRKYRQYISNKSDWWWTLTPWSTPLSGYSDLARIVLTNGSLLSDTAFYGDVGVVPGLCLLSSLDVKVVCEE